MDDEQFEMELLACIQEQIYPGEMNAAGLILIGLLEMEGKLINSIIKASHKGAKD